MKLLLWMLLLFMCALNAFSQSPAGTPLPAIQPGVPHDLAVWRAAHYSDVRYKLNLTLEKMSPVLKGTIEIKVNVLPGAQASLPASPASADAKSSPPYEGGVAEGRGGSLIILDWRKLAGHEKNSAISDVSINGRSASLSNSGENHPVAGAATPLLRKEGSLVYVESNEHLIFRDGVVSGENVIKLDFTSPILTSGSAITRYIDKEDGSEYIYSLFVPSDASTAFPVFDQPDLKAKFSLTVIGPTEWSVISNESHGLTLADGDVEAIRSAQDHDICDGRQNCPPGYKRSYPVTTNFFSETKPISTYVFAFAAGPWQEFSAPGNGSVPGAVATGAVSLAQKKAPVATTPGTDKTDQPLDIHYYVRKSQAAKFQPHAAEVFKLTREGVRYLEDYFDFKFPLTTRTFPRAGSRRQ